LVSLLQQGAALLEMPRSAIVLLQAIPVFSAPFGIAQQRFLDRLAKMVKHWNRQPSNPTRCLDLVPIPPVVLRKLGRVIKDEFVDAVDQVEVALPRDVVR